LFSTTYELLDKPTFIISKFAIKLIPMKNTPLTHIHIYAGARMVEYAGYNMPLEYTGILDEHAAVRNAAGLFDVSHMGEIWVKGKGALELLQRVTTNDVSALKTGQSQYSCLPNGKGGIVDDLIVYYFEPQKYMLVVNAANIDKDWNWINKQNTFGAELENGSDKTSILALQGPNSKKILQKLTDTDLNQLKSFTFVVGDVAGEKNVIISETGYTGAGGYELTCYNNSTEKIWNSLFEAGKDFGLKPAGLAVRDLLRLEMGYSLYGNDLDDTTSAIEANLGWIVKFVNGKNFIDRELLEKQKIDGVKRKLVAFELIDRGIPRKDYRLANRTGEDIGFVTSGSISPVIQKGIGMGYIKTSESSIGNEIFVQIRNKSLKAKVVRLPFIQK
jgi:aminomethyltransferase